MKISLQEAFGKRNDLKKLISKKLPQITSNLWEDKELPIDFKNGTKKDPNLVLAEVEELMAKLSDLNKKIYVANVANNALLRDLETVSARISMYESLVGHLTCYEGDKVRNRFYNKDDPNSKQFNENRLLVDAKAVEAKLEELQTSKREIEEALRHNNFSVTFEL